MIAAGAFYFAGNGGDTTGRHGVFLRFLSTKSNKPQ